MLYTPATKAALRLCFDAHRDQVDKGGLPYVFHPFHVAEQMQTEHEVCVALLHDVMEDSALGADDLIAAGIPEPYVQTCLLLTHRPGVAYLDYVRALAHDPVARKVKRADLLHNSDPSRLDGAPTERDLQRRARYAQALALLDAQEAGSADHGARAALLSKVQACLLAGAVGDALGYTVEFWKLADIRARFGEDGIRSFAELPARFSDDTQMTLFTAAGLATCSERRAAGEDADPVQCVRRAYLDWLVTQGGRSPEEGALCTRLLSVPELHVRRAPGITCLTALEAGGTGSLEQPVNDSKGCGGVMRVAPWGLWYRQALACPPSDDDLRELVRGGAACAALTHGHPLGWISAGALCFIVDRCAYDVPLGCPGVGWELAGIVEECADRLPSWFPAQAHEARVQARLLRRAVSLAQGDQPADACVRSLGEGWVGEEALAVAVFAAVRHADDLDAALAVAVNHDGDSDSTGAVCGNILGALRGLGAIGAQWDGVELRDLILDTAASLLPA